MKLKVFCQNPSSSGLPIEYFLLFHALLLMVFLLLEDRGRPSDIGDLYSNSISKHFRKVFHRFQKPRKIWVKNIPQSEI